MSYSGYGQPQQGAPGGYGAAPGGFAAGAPGYQGQPGGYGNAPPGGQPPFGAQPGGFGQPAGYAGAPQQQFGTPSAQGGWAAPPGMNPQVFQWFQTVDRDRSGKITATELQQALTNANWTQFNPETCRLMIGMFDRDMNGTIDVNEFNALWNYIQQWRQVFETFDANKSGSIEAPELQSAFRQMGYNLSVNFSNMIIYRFDVAGRRSLTLDNFIQSCVMLKSLTDAFKQRDKNMSGSITINYEDFLTLAVHNKA